MQYSGLINNTTVLDEVLTTPSGAVIEAMQRLQGDIMILGAGGRMGVSLALLAQNAIRKAGLSKRIICVSRFTNPRNRNELARAGIEMITCDLLDGVAIQKLPAVENVIYMVGMRPEHPGQMPKTWAVNSFLPGIVVHKFVQSRIVLFSTGHVYPPADIRLGGSSETDPVGPVGEYAQSALARERIFDFFCGKLEIRGVILRLAHAVELRYGMLLEIARKVNLQEPIDLSHSHLNLIWQGDVNSIALRAFEYAKTPPPVINVSGPETVSVRKLAMVFARHFRTTPIFEGIENEQAQLCDTTLCNRLFGYPDVSLGQLIKWTANWIKLDAPTWNNSHAPAHTLHRQSFERLS